MKFKNRLSELEVGHLSLESGRNDQMKSGWTFPRVGLFPFVGGGFTREVNFNTSIGGTHLINTLFCMLYCGKNLHQKTIEGEITATTKCEVGESFVVLSKERT